MEIGDWLLLAGLVIATFAAMMLAYDALFGTGHRFQARLATTQQENLQALRETLQERIRTLPPVYTDEDKRRYLEEDERVLGPWAAKLKDRESSIMIKHEDRTVSFALGGLLLLIFAFALQFVGSLLLALNRS